MKYKMKKSEFMQLVGKKVQITLFDGDTLSGTLNYADDFSEKHDFRPPGYFYIIGDRSRMTFRYSHVVRVKEL